MACEDAGPFRFQCVPHVAVKVVVTGQEKPARFGERYRGNTADDVIVGVHGQFLIGPYIEQPTGGIIGTGRKRVPIREECDGVDIAFVSRERLLTLSLSDIPQFGGSVARTGDKHAALRRKGQCHNVAGMSEERCALLTGFDVPQPTGHVP